MCYNNYAYSDVQDTNTNIGDLHKITHPFSCLKFEIYGGNFVAYAFERPSQHNIVKALPQVQS